MLNTAHFLARSCILLQSKLSQNLTSVFYGDMPLQETMFVGTPIGYNSRFTCLIHFTSSKGSRLSRAKVEPSALIFFEPTWQQNNTCAHHQSNISIELAHDLLDNKDFLSFCLSLHSDFPKFGLITSSTR